ANSRMMRGSRARAECQNQRQAHRKSQSVAHVSAPNGFAHASAHVALSALRRAARHLGGDRVEKIRRCLEVRGCEVVQRYAQTEENLGGRSLVDLSSA